MKTRHLILWTVLSAAIGCGDGGITPNLGPIPSTRIANKSQFLLNELRVHGATGYLQTMNLLPEPMQIDTEVMYYGAGESWFTVLRQKAERAEVLAFTTAEPVILVRNAGYRLTIFDDSFRIDEEDYVRPDRYDGLVLGNPGPRCEWAATATTADCDPND